MEIRPSSRSCTTDTIFNANAPNDRIYNPADSLIGIVNPNVAVGGFGLSLVGAVLGTGVGFTNSGFISVDQATPALLLSGGGGLVTYTGTGTLTNSGAGQALRISGSSGAAQLTVGGNITSNTGLAVDIAASSITYTQNAGTVVSSAIGGGADAVQLISDTGVVASLGGATVGGEDAVELQALGGNATVDLTGTLAASSEGIDVSAAGSATITTSGNIDAARSIQAAALGLVTVNMTGGQINSTTAGMELVSSDTGGVVVDMTGGQIGSATQRAGGVGIVAQANGAAGALDLTVSSVWSNSTALLPSIGHAANGEDITLTINGTVDSLGGNGISADHLGTGDIFINNNGTITAFNTAISALTTSGNAHVFNSGTITSTGAAIFFAAGNDTLTLTPTSVINGEVIAQSGFDTLQLGGTAGTGTFDVSDIDNAQQYRFFEIFNVIGATWILGNDVALTALEPLANDLNGDFHSDIVWRDDAGVVALWEMDGASVLSNQGVGTLPAGADIADVDGDFNADGASDILWRGADGTAVLWEMDGPAIIAETAIATLPAYWHIADTGDLNGDGRHDILWRDAAGVLVLWEMDGPNVVGNTLVANAPASQVEAVADFTGDGRGDILLRDQDGTIRLWEMNGANIVADTVLAVLPDYWQFADTDAGTIVLWEMDGPAIVDNTAVNTIPTSWQIVA